MQSSNYHAIKHDIILIQRHHEIIVARADGQEIASLTVETMERDILSDVDAEGNLRWKTVPTQSFWLRFHPVSAETGRDSADVNLNSDLYFDDASRTWISRPFALDKLSVAK